MSNIRNVKARRSDKIVALYPCTCDSEYRNVYNKMKDALPIARECLPNPDNFGKIRLLQPMFISKGLTYDIECDEMVRTVSLPIVYLTDLASIPYPFSFLRIKPHLIFPAILHDYLTGNRIFGKTKDGMKLTSRAFYAAIRYEEKLIGKKISFAWLYYIFTQWNPIYRGIYMGKFKKKK